MRLLLGIAATLLGGGSALFFLIETVMGARSWFWPGVAGTIISSDVVTTRDADGPGHLARVKYQYQIDGVVHRGDRLRFGGGVSTSFRSWAERQSERYVAGAAVMVRVSPNDPALSVLQPGVPWYLIVFLLICAGFTAMGINVVVRALES